MRYFFIIVLLILPATSFAAGFQQLKQPGSVKVGDTFTTTLSLRTDLDVINAAEGSVHFSQHSRLSIFRLQGFTCSVVGLFTN